MAQGSGKHGDADNRVSPLFRALTEEERRRSEPPKKEGEAIYHYTSNIKVERYKKVDLRFFPESVLSTIFRLAFVFFPVGIYTVSWRRKAGYDGFVSSMEYEILITQRNFVLLSIVLDKVLEVVNRHYCLIGGIPSEKVTYAFVYLGDKDVFEIRMIIPSALHADAIRRRHFSNEPRYDPDLGAQKQGDTEDGYEAIREIGKIFPVLSYFPPPSPTLDWQIRGGDGSDKDDGSGK